MAEPKAFPRSATMSSTGNWADDVEADEELERGKPGRSELGGESMAAGSSAALGATSA